MLQYHSHHKNKAATQTDNLGQPTPFKTGLFYILEGPDVKMIRTEAADILEVRLVEGCKFLCLSVYDSKMKLQKRKKKAPLIAISQESHRFCTKGCNSTVSRGTSEEPTEDLNGIGNDIAQKVPCSNPREFVEWLQHSG
ncbi:hypothetical protein AVEN_35591-1 [Araneus ventricosus]|uniref:Uncharacterized protein n=1 Tax=Araneus ventricosus TaxID=182803 RepID=A0A4Y2CM76_ARAVE|nr:hypothetical protein AVEN_35591-1 [Araneus ventricosus]